jgi:general secretion pathway protein G
MELNMMDANRGNREDKSARWILRAAAIFDSRQRQGSERGKIPQGERGLTLVELIVTVAILGILASVAYPIARFKIQRQKEQVLRDDLWTMRRAIDKYKDAADRKAFQVSIDSNGYPPDLDTLVNGVDVQGKKVKFLRQIPVDPMTGKKDWVLRSMQDDPDSDSWGGQDVFDVHSASEGTGLDGTKYNTW